MYKAISISSALFHWSFVPFFDCHELYKEDFESSTHTSSEDIPLKGSLVPGLPLLPNAVPIEYLPVGIFPSPSILLVR